MVGPINKTLDLVITIVPPNRSRARRRRFDEAGRSLGVALAGDEASALATLPIIEQDRRDDVSEVAVALEAKAFMTEHVKSLPRLHADSCHRLSGEEGSTSMQYGLLLVGQRSPDLRYAERYGQEGQSTRPTG